MYNCFTDIINNLKNKIKQIVKNCKMCKINKPSIKHQENQVITNTASQAFEEIAIDTVGPLPITSMGNRYIVSVQDNLTKYVIYIPVPDKLSSTVAKAFLENVVLDYGAPIRVRSDQGREYLNQVFSDLENLLNIHHVHSTAFHPQSKGSLERNHRVFNEYMRNFSQSEGDWDQITKYFQFAYNTTPHAVTGYSPFELIFGKTCKFPFDMLNTSPQPVYNYDHYFNVLKNHLHTTLLKAKQLILKEKSSRINKANNKITQNLNFKVGDKVKLRIGNRNKSDPYFDGPYIIVNIEGPNATIKHQFTNSEQTVHKKRLNFY